MDDEGLDPEALEAELRSRDEPPSFLYTIPTFQNPSGRTLSAERRARLVEIVREHELAVLEDDPYGLVRFEGRAAGEPPRARGRGARHVHVVLLEDRRSGRAHRLLRASGSRRGGLRGACRLDVHLAAVPPAGGRRRVRRARSLRAEPRARSRRAAGASRRDARARLPRTRPPDRRGAIRRAATSSGSSSTAPTRRLSRRMRRGRASRSSPGRASSPRAPDGATSARLAYSYETPERITEGVERLMRLLG